MHLLISQTILAYLAASAAAAWPDTPFVSSGRNIKSASGSTVVYAGVNWPGAADTMLPEGLQYRSVADIVSSVKSLGMNVIRLTYAIQMVDDIFANNPNQGLKKTLINALGSTNGNNVFQMILKNNPSFTETTTRLQVFDAVAAECAKQQIWIHLDNHVSKAQWCCGTDDGNAWFGDVNFPVSNWQRGLGYMANHAKSWPALASMSLRNELRQSTSSNNQAQPYDWAHWYINSKPAMDIINGNNSVPLIFLSGLGYDTDDTAITNGQNLGTVNGHNQYFKPSDFSYGNKLVYELHDYEGSSSCTTIKGNLNHNGYQIMDPNSSSPIHAPMVLTEFGFDMTGNDYQGAYAQCIKSFLSGLPGGPGGWMQWVLSGSYYIRQGTQDSDELWGLFNHDWTAWRSSAVINNYVKPFVASTRSP